MRSRAGAGAQAPIRGNRLSLQRCLVLVSQVHGFPKIMGVLTHLDKFKSAKAMRTAK